MIRRIPIAIILALAACPKGASASPPPHFPVDSLHVVKVAAGVDSLVTTYTCPAAGANTGCGVLAFTAGGGAIVAPNSLVGATGRIAVACSTPGASVSLTVSFTGIVGALTSASNGQASVLNGTCPQRATVPGVIGLSPLVPVSGGP